MKGAPPIPDACFDCVHYIGLRAATRAEETPEAEPEVIDVCQAFPRGIPQVILSGRDMHRTAFAGDGGIFYRQRP